MGARESGERGAGSGRGTAGTRRILAVWVAFLGMSAFACQRAPVRTIEIEAVDYSFNGLGAVPPGPASFKLINRDDVPHQVQLYRLRPGIHVDSAWKLLALHDFPTALTTGSPLIMSATAMDSGHTRVSADLEKGEVWALICMFRDSPTDPVHSADGMYAVLEVK